MTDLSFPPLRPCCPTFDHEPHQPDCDTPHPATEGDPS